MRRNPFRLTLAILGIGFLAIGGVIVLIGLVPNDAGPGNPGPSRFTVGAVGGWLVEVGWLPFLGWLIVSALEWSAPPLDENLRTEDEIREMLRRKSDPQSS